MTHQREPEKQPEAWEGALREGLDGLSDLGREEPPNLADMQMLVAQVQQEQRSRTVRDLVLFLTCAVLLLAGVLFAISRDPVYFIALQGVAAAGLIAGGLVYFGLQGKRVAD